MTTARRALVSPIATIAFSSLLLGQGVALASGGPQPSALPGQPGGDPAPDTNQAADQVKRGRYEDAITSCKRALARDEHYVPALVVMAKSYFYLKKYELSRAIIDLAQKLDARNAESYNLLGFIALQSTPPDNISATAAFKKATECQGDYGTAWNNLAAQYLLAKNYDAALDAASRATKLLPNFDKAHLNLGAALRGKGQFADAESEFRAALKLHPDYADAYYNLGVLYLDAPKMGDMDLVTKLNTAIAHLSKYKNLASYKLTKDDPADGFIDDARKGIDREQKRLSRLAKQKERDAAKAAQPPAPAPAQGGQEGKKK